LSCLFVISGTLTDCFEYSLTIIRISNFRDEANRQAVIEERIRHYFNQLTVGCGDSTCPNQNCASSPNFAHRGIDNNRAAALALRLLGDSEPMCFRHSNSSDQNRTSTRESTNRQSRNTGAQTGSGSNEIMEIPEASIAPPVQERMEAGDPDQERDEDVELPDTLEGSAPTSSISEISPALSRFLLHISGTSPPTEALTNESAVNTDPPRHNYLLDLLESITKRNMPKTEEGEEDSEFLSPSATFVSKRVKGLTLAEVQECIEDCERSNQWTPLSKLLSEVFRSLTALANSFPRGGVVGGVAKSSDIEMHPTSSSSKAEVMDSESTPSTNNKKDEPEKLRLFFNDESDPAIPVNIDEAREAYKLLLERPPKSFEIETTLTRHIMRLLIVALRKFFRAPYLHLPSSSSSHAAAMLPSDPYIAQLEILNPLPGKESDKVQQWMVNLFATLYACPLITDPLHFEPILPHLCQLTVALPMATQARLCRTWAQYAISRRNESGSSTTATTSEGGYWLLDLHRILMQQITLCCLTLEPPSNNASSDLEDTPTPNDDRVICDVSRVVRIVFYASLLAGGCDPPEQLKREAAEAEEILAETSAAAATSSSFSFRVSLVSCGTQLLLISLPIRQSRNPLGLRSLCALVLIDQCGLLVLSERAALRKDPIGTILGISPNDCRHPLIPPKEFLNETLNDFIVVEKDFANFRSKRSSPSSSSTGWPEKLSFMELPFMLQTTTKITQLHYDNRLNMLHERQGAIFHALFATSNLDAALEMPYFKICVNRDRVLELTRMDAVGDLKKQLYVEFDGEQGIDEGGPSKEFFQLIVERIFNPDYGMFVFEEESQCFWFNRNPMAEELEREYCLIGTILGLAIYNSVILDIHFPAVLFRKLCGKLASGLEDLSDGWPSLAHGLQALLDYDGDDFEGDHCINFVVNYKDMFGQAVSHELIPNGASIPVTKANRQEFVDKTVDFLLNTSVKKQFAAFRKGFLLVNYDFNELERVTEYEGDYNTETPIIRQFWSVVHSMSEEEQRRLLQFATGTDRIPVGGMSRMKFVIARQGPDSDRLPTAHTCFNVLLLPEYSSQEKLERCLRTAIDYSKGFGMF
uniref:HECT-type E3 ubiquitin transferase n=1 Tax=Hymenolepis diminuta TaxID=6216 RepID=A0A158QCF5_HYMDI